MIVAGGMGKMTKLAQGLLDLHSKRGAVDHAFLASFAEGEVAEQIRAANSAKHAFEIAASAGVNLGEGIVEKAWRTAAKVLREIPTELEVVIFDRDGGLLARTGFRKVGEAD